MKLDLFEDRLILYAKGKEIQLFTKHKLRSYQDHIEIFA